MKKIIFVSVGVIVSLVLLIIALPWILSVFSKDIAPIDDSDLQLPGVFAPPPQNNFFYDMEELHLVLSYEDRQRIIDILDETAKWDENFVGKVLSDDAATLEVFDRMAEKPFFQDPNYAIPENISIFTPLVNINTIRQIAMLSGLKAIKFAKGGMSEDAFDEAIKSLELGQKIEDSQSPLIYYLVGVSLKNIGLDTIESIAQLALISPEKVARLEEFKEKKEWIVNTFKGEYMTQKNIINLVGAGDQKTLNEAYGFTVFNIKYSPKNKFYFKPNKTKKIFADYARESIANINQPCGQAIAKERNPMVDPSLLKLFFTENLIGKMLHDLVAVNLSSINNKSCEIDSRISSIQETLK